MPDSTVQRDEQLASLLAQLADQQKQGQTPSVETLAWAHPELADELRQLWATAQFAQELVGPRDVLRTLSLSAGFTQTSAQASLPRAFGDYELLTELGRGGMGIVYKAFDKKLQRFVALKMLLRGELASEADLARFRAEAQAAGALGHDHIVPVYSVSEHEGQAYFCMQYLEGGSLAQKLSAGPLPERESAQLLLPIAQAIEFAHSQGLLHRDLKPANVLLDVQGKPLVSDFGLARRVQGNDKLTRTGAILGTPSYMSPEQAAGSRGTLTAGTDVYSLGAVLYEMLTGRPPFQAASTVDTLFLVLEQPPVPPRALNPTVSREMELICLKCLQKSADLRYPSAGALAKDLHAYLHHEPISVLSFSFSTLLGRLFRETHHATVLENWGLLWMWHSLIIFLLCLVTNLLHWQGKAGHLAYLALWSIGLVTWGCIFWTLRQRGGPVAFIERQIAHVWAGGVISTIVLFLVEVALALPPLTLTPVLAIAAGAVFTVKACMLSGMFYFTAGAMYLLALPMAWYPQYAPTLFGIASAVSFFVPGLKYHRQRIRTLARRAE